METRNDGEVPRRNSMYILTISVVYTIDKIKLELAKKHERIFFGEKKRLDG